MKQRLLAQRLLALFGAGVLVFTAPLLQLWSAGVLFGLWALLIALLAWLMEGGLDE